MSGRYSNQSIEPATGLSDQQYNTEFSSRVDSKSAIRVRKPAWMHWEEGLLILVIDWYTVQGSRVAIWDREEEPDGIAITFRKWHKFLNDNHEFYKLEGSLRGDYNLFQRKDLYDKWKTIQSTCEQRKHSIAALYKHILPLIEALETGFKIRICYIPGDRLPGDEFLLNDTVIDDKVLGKYEVKSQKGKLTTAMVKNFHNQAVEARENKEKSYHVASLQTEVRESKDDLWTDEMQAKFRSIREREEASHHQEFEGEN